MSGFLRRTQERTAEKREAVAGELLAWEKLTDAIGLAAAAGQSRATMTPAAPIKIRQTTAAIEAVERLTKAGFRPTWTDDRRSPSGPTGDQLEVEW